MQVPIALSFLGLEHNDPAAAAVERWVSRLAQLRYCDVEIELRRGGYHVRVRAQVTSERALHATAAREDIYVAIADAFRGVHRQLREPVAAQLAS